MEGGASDQIQTLDVGLGIGIWAGGTEYSILNAEYMDTGYRDKGETEMRKTNAAGSIRYTCSRAVKCSLTHIS